MKIVHISTYDSGGAAVAAIRLHKELLKENIESSFLCAYGSKEDIPNYYQESPVKTPLLYRVLNKLGIPITQNQKYWKRMQALEGTFEIVTLPFQDADFSEHPLVKEADVIHFHFIAYFIDIPSFMKKVKKPIVWTLHDMNPFSGCFHYDNDVKNNIKNFKKLEDELTSIKTKAYASHDKMKIVGPSHWMKELAEDSKVFGDKEHVQIYYCIDTNVFKYRDKQEMRVKHQLPADKTILLFVSADIDNYRKGFDLLVKAANQLKSQDYLLLCIGKVSEETKSISNCQNLGSIYDERKMAEIYAAADVFVMPSREDNLPNTMLESLCCGTPMITFSNGGMKDEVVTGENGVLIDIIESNKLMEAIENVINNKYHFDSEAISENAQVRYNPKKQVKEQIELYQSFFN
ncbi:MAG: glycosyltransferase involved in cell wall biosynthesis [Bacteroidia bacterium]|jgi:glycosyltransferase involved in cell wall biosynthesis